MTKWTMAMLGVCALGGCTGTADCPTGTASVGEGCVELDSDGGSSIASDGATGDAMPDAPSCNPGAADPIDLGGTDTNCDGVDGVDEAQVYVAPSGNDLNFGTRSHPVRTIGRALEAAAGRPVVIALGTYEGETLNFSGVRISLHGGYDPSQGWARASERSKIVSGPAGVRFVDLPADAVFERVEFESAAATEYMASSYTIVLAGVADAHPKVTLRDARLVAGAGGPGFGFADSPEGAPGAPGQKGDYCHRNSDGTCATGGANLLATPRPVAACLLPEAQGGTGGGSTGWGQPSAAGRPGGFSGEINPAGAGGPGTPGGNGAAGTHAGLGSAVGTFSLEGYSPPWAVNGGDGHPGEGGGGGGGGTAWNEFPCAPIAVTAWLYGSAGGSGGNGGCGGPGGAGGTGGGGSIGLLASRVSLHLEDTSIVTAEGGPGGRGGAGGPGGGGGSPGQGGESVCGRQSGSQPVRRALAGGPGGSGGNGGPGGHGAGGAGGPSVGVVLMDGTAMQKDAATTIVLGSPAPGGESVGIPGAAGMTIDVYDANAN